MMVRDERMGLHALLDVNASDVITFTTTTIASVNGHFDVSPWTLGAVDLATGAIRTLATTSDITYYAWSPDGKRLAYLAPPDATQLVPGLSLVILDADSSTVWRFTGDSDLINVHPVWFPDSERLLLAGAVTRDEPCTPFYSVAVASGQLQPYTRLPHRASDWSWSPDCQYIAFASAGGEPGDIFVYDVVAGTTERFAAPAGYPYVQDIQWSPDGAHIALAAAQEDGDTGLFVMMWDGTNIHRVAELTSERGEHHFAWSPGGQRLAFMNTDITEEELPRLQRRLGAVEITAEEPRWLAIDINAEGDEIVLDAPAWSHDGTRIVYASYLEGGHNLYVVAADGSTVPRRITHDTNANGDAIKYSLSWRPTRS